MSAPSGAGRRESMVVDTMVFVYAAVETSGYSAECDDLFARGGEVFVPDRMFGELAEALRDWVTSGSVTVPDAAAALRDVESVVSHVSSTRGLASRALELALERRHPVYGALFVALAEQRDTRVVTYDRRLLAAFPERAVSVPAFLAESA